MATTDSEWTARFIDRKRRLEEYKETISRLFPTLPRDLVDARSINDADALVLALFLRCIPHEGDVLEVGTDFGVSTFYLASQPSVLRVLGVVNQDPPEDEEAGERSEPLAGPKPVDVARAALAEFADESAKIRLQTGDERGAWTNHLGATPDTSGDGPLLAFSNGARTREAVVTNLQAIFDANTRAIAILDHCKGGGAPFVHAGIADYMERAKSEYHFRLFGDLTSGVATSNLGIVYPDEDSAEVHRYLAELGRLFSERMDPLWLACREQEMIGIVNTYRNEAESLSRQHQGLIGEYDDLEDRNKVLQKRTSWLEKRKSQLQEINTALKGEKKDLQKRASQLEKRVSQLDKRKSQLQEINAGLKEEKKGLKYRASQSEKHTSQLEKRKSQLEGRNSRLEERNSRLEERNSRLKEERLLLDSQLTDYRTSGRYRLADTVTKNVLRIPGAKALARRTGPKE